MNSLAGQDFGQTQSHSLGNDGIKSLYTVMTVLKH